MMHVLQAEAETHVGVLVLSIGSIGGAAMYRRAEDHGTGHTRDVFSLQVNSIANANIGFVQGNMLSARDQTGWIDIFHIFFLIMWRHYIVFLLRFDDTMMDWSSHRRPGHCYFNIEHR